MTPTCARCERILIALLLGLLVASLAWVISTGLHMRHVWPGTIFGFAFGSLNNLIWRRPR